MKINININNEEKEIDSEELKNYSDKNIYVIKNTNSKKYKSNIVKGKITGAMPLIVTAVYLLIGFVWGIWHPTWLLFLLIPLVPIALYGIGDNKKSANGITTFIVIISYIILGLFGYWHPGWLIFFLIPIVAIFTGNDDEDDDEN